MHEKLTIIAIAANPNSSTGAKGQALAPEEKLPGWLDVISDNKP